MKKLIYLLSILFILVFIASCGSEGNILQKNEERTNDVPVTAVEDIAEYKIVRAESASAGEKEVATDLHKTLSRYFEGMQISTDYTSSPKEILIGNTRRSESKKAAEGLKDHDFVIKKDGNKIVIVGGSDEALKTAANLLKAKLLDKKGGRLLMPTSENGYSFIVKYTVDVLAIEGVPFESFEIYNESLMSEAAVNGILSLNLGISLKSSPEMLKNKHYLILRGEELIADKYSIKIEDGNVIISGSAHSLPLALEFFSGSYLESLGKKVVNLEAKDSTEGSTGKKEIYTRDQLMSVIEKVYADPNIIIVGEQLPGKTKPWVFEEMLNSYKEATGEKPGIVGVDLACYGIDLMETDQLSWSSYICDMVDYAADGGIITISAHWENPSGNTGGQPRVRGNFGYEHNKEAYEKAFTDLITEGTEYNTFFKRELDTNIKFLKALMDNGVPVIWRPLHEANGNFFWYCVRQNNITLDASYIVNVWRYVYEYFEENGLENLIWCYAPNYSTNTENKQGYHMSNTYLYPGDEYCDMVGVDWYSGGELEITTNENYLKLIETAGKPGAITEFGPGGDIIAEKREDQPELYNAMDLYGNLYQLSKEGYSFVYVLSWTGDKSISVLGRGDEFLAQDMTLGQKEVKALFDSLP